MAQAHSVCSSIFCRPFNFGEPRVIRTTLHCCMLITMTVLWNQISLDSINGFCRLWSYSASARWWLCSCPLIQSRDVALSRWITSDGNNTAITAEKHCSTTAACCWLWSSEQMDVDNATFHCRSQEKSWCDFLGMLACGVPWGRTSRYQSWWHNTW